MRRMTMLAVIVLLVTLACAVQASDVEVGVLWSTHTGIVPNLQGSVPIWTDADWTVFADTYAALDLSSAGVGISLQPPPTTPILSTFLSVLQADRAGPAITYEFEQHEWVASFVFIHTISF